MLTEEACELIGEEYSKIRSHDFENSDLARTQPVTARALETLIRLSTAHAKARLSKSIDREDAETAIELVQVLNILQFFFIFCNNLKLDTHSAFFVTLNLSRPI